MASLDGADRTFTRDIDPLTVGMAGSEPAPLHLSLPTAAKQRLHLMPADDNPTRAVPVVPTVRSMPVSGSHHDESRSVPVMVVTIVGADVAPLVGVHVRHGRRTVVIMTTVVGAHREAADPATAAGK